MWICPFSALVGQKKTFVSWLAKEERREALSIPEARRGAEASTARTIAPRGAAQAGLTEGAERSLEFARKRMSKEEISRRLRRIPQSEVRAKAGSALSDISDWHMYRKDPRRRIYVAAGLNHGYSVHDPRGRSHWCELPQAFHRAYPATRKPACLLTPARYSTMSLLSAAQWQRCCQSCICGIEPSRSDTRRVSRSCLPLPA